MNRNHEELKLSHFIVLFSIQRIMQWLYVWFFLVILVVVLNKTFFSVLNCHYPTTISWYLLFLTPLWLNLLLIDSSTFLLYIFWNSHVLFPSKFKMRSVTADLLKRLFLISILFSINIVLANYSLRYCSLALDQVHGFRSLC